MKVFFENAEQAQAFVADASSLKCDVDISDGSRFFDAKSIVAVMALDFNKKFNVRPVTNDYDEIIAFNDLMRKYEWKESKK